MEPSKNKSGSTEKGKKEQSEADYEADYIVFRSVVKKMKRLTNMLLSLEQKSDHSLKANMDLFMKASKLENEIAEEMKAYHESHYINTEEMYRSKEYQKLIAKYKKMGLDARPEDPQEKQAEKEVLEELSRLVKSGKSAR
jgi:hypothetical protein